MGQPKAECSVLEPALSPQPQKPYIHRGPPTLPPPTPKQKTILPGFIEEMIACMIVGGNPVSKWPAPTSVSHPPSAASPYSTDACQAAHATLMLMPIWSSSGCWNPMSPIPRMYRGPGPMGTHSYRAAPTSKISSPRT